MVVGVVVDYVVAVSDIVISHDELHIFGYISTQCSYCELFSEPCKSSGKIRTLKPQKLN